MKRLALAVFLVVPLSFAFGEDKKFTGDAKAAPGVNWGGQTVKATGSELPSSDRIAHLLLALRTDESGFTTVANLAFSGARWRPRSPGSSFKPPDHLCRRWWSAR